MASDNSKQTGPLQNLFGDIQKIIDFMEIKDQKAADDAESEDSKKQAEMWMNANLGKDTYVTYKHYWTIAMFQEVVPNSRLIDIRNYMENPYNIPAIYRENLLEKGRQAFLDSYVETNEYYRMLNGLPPIDTPSSEFVYLTEPMRNQLHASDEPVHLLSPLIQNNYMGTDEYKTVLANNPNKKYLKYLGLYKIDTFTARNAKDFEIIRYSLNRSDINPNLINTFASLYSDYREYVMATLYNEQFENIYAGYRNFMGVLILAFTLMQISNKGTEALNDKNFLDDSILHTILDMYGIPDDLMLPNEVRRDLVINILKLIQNKGTDTVYYDLVDILGYENINISKLLLMKGQKFDDKNNYSTNKNDVEPYFLQLDLKDENPYDTITKGNATIHKYKDIIDNDPTWWDLDDTKKILNESEYSIADSKYIMIEAIIPQIKYLFESIYFARLILDNKNFTDEFMIEIPEIFGTEMVSIYDLIIFIICAMCMNNDLTGEFVDEDKLLATAGFNFDMDLDSFEEYVNNSFYLDKDRIMSFMENLTIRTPADINRLYNEIMYPMREWLEDKISNSSNRKEYIEYENIYRSLYTYDLSRKSFLNDFKTPLETIKEKYNLTDDELLMYQSFYPHTMSGKTITIKDFNNSRYSPFIDRLDNIDWNIHIVLDDPTKPDDRGYLYFYDILNCEDLRELTNEDGTRIFMDYEDPDIGWQINNKAVEKALEMIDALDDTDLHKAVMKVTTVVPNSNGKTFYQGEKLPASIRNGLYKDILKDKLLMDAQGLAKPPETYQEYLYRKNEKLYDLLTKDNRFELNRQSWLNDVTKIMLAVESELDMHLKYFEQSVLGSELFFKPLITLIKYFKSTFVDIAKTSLKYTFSDKIDAGGNSNMFKIFDEVKFIVHFVTLANRGYESQFGLYDTEHSMKHKIIIKDRSELLRMKGNGFDVHKREARMGSMRLVDEVKFYKNGKEVDPDGSVSYWYPGEHGTGRWSSDEDIIMAYRDKNTRATNMPVDLDGWKEFVESYNYD